MICLLFTKDTSLARQGKMTEIRTTNTNTNTMDTTETFTIMPPAPPKVDIGSGDFSYVTQHSERVMLQTAFQAITITENWAFVNQNIASFSLSSDKRVATIYYKIEELGYTGHSGCSFGCTMRNMQYIARHGGAAFKKIWKN